MNLPVGLQGPKTAPVDKCLREIKSQKEIDF